MQEPKTPSDCCILVAEDDPILRYITVTTLRRHGYNVLEASDGAEAIWLAETHSQQRIDLLISDFQMPHVNGDEVAHRLKVSRPQLEILIVTGAVLDDFPKDPDIDHIEFLQKPVLADSLLTRVHALLGC